VPVLKKSDLLKYSPINKQDIHMRPKYYILNIKTFIQGIPFRRWLNQDKTTYYKVQLQIHLEN